jgi:hypothetical protein
LKIARRGAWSLLALVLAVVVGGCGVGAGEGTEDVQLTVTRDFGVEELTEDGEQGDAEPSETVMQQLQGSLEVETRYGGRFVQSIEGFAGGRREGRPVDWFYYVNGIESDTGAAERALSPGDRVWWDLHDWGEAMRIPAVVGSFPEPFVSGTGGKRLPVRLECTSDAERECDEVAERLAAAGVTQVARATPGTPASDELLRVVVGPWSSVRADPTLSALERGPADSGIYARLDRGGRTIEVLDAEGETVRELGAGSGLVAATRFAEQSLVWVVTGTDQPGVAAAAGALTEEALANRFAVAIDEGEAIGLPATPAGSPAP